jgi:hypothetical protein
MCGALATRAGAKTTLASARNRVGEGLRKKCSAIVCPRFHPRICLTHCCGGVSDTPYAPDLTSATPLVPPDPPHGGCRHVLRVLGVPREAVDQTWLVFLGVKHTILGP